MDPMQTIDEANAELEGCPTQTIEQANAELEGRPTQTIEQANAELEGRPTQTIDQANAELEGRKPEQGSVAGAAVKGAITGLADGAWEGAKAGLAKATWALPKLFGGIERAAGNIINLGGNAPNKVGNFLINFANAADADFEEWMPTSTAERLGYEDWGTKTGDFFGNVAAMAVKFAPAMMSGGTTAVAGGTAATGSAILPKVFLESVLASDGVNAYADTRKIADENGADPVFANFLGGLSGLVNYFGGKALMASGGVAKDIKNPLLRELVTAAASGGALGAQGGANKAITNAAEGKPIGEGVVGAVGEGFAEGVGFHAANMIPRIPKLIKETDDHYNFAKNKIMDFAQNHVAELNQLMNTPETAAALEARKAGGDITDEAAEAMGLPKNMKQKERNAVADALLNYRNSEEAKAAEAARIAAEEEKVAKEQQRVAASELRGKESVAEQMAGIDEMGVGSWEEAEAKGLTEKDETGAYRGGARQALNIAIHGTDKLKGAVKSGAMSGDTAEAILTTAQCELGARPVEDRAALVDAIVDKAGGDEALTKGILRKLTEEEVATGTEAIEARVERAAEQVKAEAIAARNGVDEATARSVSVEPVETADGRLTTVGDQVAAEESTARSGAVTTKPQTALEGFENAERLKGTELKVTNNGTMTCNTFPELRLDVSQDGVSVRGITPETMAKPANAADAAAVVARAYQVAKRNGVKLVFESEAAAKTAAGLMVEVQRESLARAQKRLDTRAKMFDLLLGNGLGTHVTFDFDNFKKALEASGTGRRFINQAGDIYAFEDGKGGIHFNPQHLRMDTPFHEYGHLARAVVEKVNPSLWRRGTDLIGETEYFREIAEMAKGEKHPYHGLDEAALREEAICNLLGDRGAKIIESKGAGAELKAWIREFWKAIKDALGIADLTEEQIEKMTLEEIADAVNSELLRGREFGKRTKPSGLSRRQAALKRMQGQEDAYWEQKAEAEEEAARQAYIASGGTAMDYVKSRAMESEAPLDLNWEAMRELANDIAEGRFAAGKDEWMSENADWRLRQGWTLNPKGVTSKELRALSALVPEKHHFGSEQHGRDVVLENMYPPDYANSPEVRFVKQFNENEKDLSTIRKALYLIYGGYTHNKKAFAKLGDKNFKPTVSVNKEEVQKRHDKLLSEERELLSKRQQIQKTIGYPDYKNSPEWQSVNEAYNAKRTERLSLTPEQIAFNNKITDHERQWSETLDKRFEEYRDNRISEGIKLLDELAKRRGVKTFNEMIEEKSPEEPKLNRGRDASYHGEEFTKSDAEKSTGNFSAKGRVMDDAARKGKFAVGGVYTGSAADYEKPSLQKIGTGEGSQVYGWGLYGSKVRDVAEGYANRLGSEYLRLKNGEIIQDSSDEANYIIPHGKKAVDAIRRDANAERESGNIEAYKRLKEIIPNVKRILKIGYDIDSTKHLYEQTFFTNREPGDESHLLSWYKRIGSRKEKLITSQLEKEGWKKEKQELGQFVGAQNTYTANISTFKKIVDGTVRKIQLFESMQARDLYDELSKWPNSPKAASEFLARADIDGIKYPVDSYGKSVKDGDKAGWNYVSFRDDNITVDHKWVDGEQKFQAMKPEEIDMSLFTWKKPGENDLAMGDTEQKPAGIAAGIEKKEALRPWTKKMSPADQAKPIAFDAADMVMLWRAVSGSLRNPVIKNGDHIPGHKNWLGMNRGGDYIELASKLFGVIDAGDIERMREGLKSEGMFRHLDPAWRAKQSKLSIRTEQDRSEAELDKRTRALYEKRVTTGEGGEHYATQVLGHEIGHTLAKMPPDKNLGPIGNDLKTLFEAMKGRMLRHKDPLMKKGDVSAMEQVRQLIAWWHGTEKMPEYYEKPEERFAELFGIFLTQPESVQSMAPKAYDICVDAIAKSEKLTKAYRHVAELKWKGQSNDAVMKRLRATWEADAQKQYRKLADETKESVSSWKDAFNYALNDRFGPLFGISKRGIKAEKARLDQAVKEGKMSEQEAADRLGDMKAETDAMRTSLYNYQRQSGGSTRLMISHFDEVKYNAEKAGVSWEDVRDYAHLMRVIEVGGRATAHGIDPARAAAILGDMARRLGAEKWAGVEKTAKAFRACYESDVLDDPNVKELFDEMTNKMLAENKHYVTMKHRMGVEEAADWQKRIEEYRKGNRDAWDPCIDIQTRLNKGLGDSGGEGGGGFVLHRLVGSFEATEDPLAATIKRAIEIKEAAARNHLIKQTSETLRACGAKGVFDSVVKSGGGHAVDPEVYGKLFYMDKGVKHELIVPKIVWMSFKGDTHHFDNWFTNSMGFIRNTITLWNPGFIKRAYLLDKNSVETNIEGMRKPVVDIVAEAIGNRFISAPLYMINNYGTRFTKISKTWWGKILWPEKTFNNDVLQAQKIARMAYEGRFGEHLDEARRLREIGENGKAAEIEQNVAHCQEMMRRNIFQSKYQFLKTQKGLSTDDILKAYGYRIGGDAAANTWYGRTWQKIKAAAQRGIRFEEEQEAVPKIVAYLYELKRDEAAGRFGEAAAQARARKVIEYGGTPNLSARGVWASNIENALGFFWNVRKEGSLRTLRAIKDHPTEWMTKNLAQTAFPALLKALMLTGGLNVLIRKLFDDDEEKIKRSWWAASVINYTDWYRYAMKCVPGYYQQNYNVVPLAQFGNHVLTMRLKYSPEEFAIQNAVHVAMQKLGHDPTDPSADWSTITKHTWEEFLPEIFGSNYLAENVQMIVGPLVGVNPYDKYRQRNVYDKTTWNARWDAPGHMVTEIGKNVWNYSPLGTFTTTFKNGQERKLDENDVPAWLDAVLKTPFVRIIPASTLAITSSDSYDRAIKEVEQRKIDACKIEAQEVLIECIANGVLGGFERKLGDLPPEMRVIAIRHVINGWRQYHADPQKERIKKALRMKDPYGKRKVFEFIKQAELYGD